MATVKHFDCQPSAGQGHVRNPRPAAAAQPGSRAGRAGQHAAAARRLRTTWRWSCAPTTSTTKPTAGSTPTCGRCTTRGAGRFDPAGRAAQECRRSGIRRRHGLSGRGACNRSPRRPTPSYYAEIVRDKATLRSLIHSSTEILRDAYDGSLEPREMLARAEQKIFAILDSRGSRQGGGYRAASCRRRWIGSTPG